MLWVQHMCNKLAVRCQIVLHVLRLFCLKRSYVVRYKSYCHKPDTILCVTA